MMRSAAVSSSTALDDLQIGLGKEEHAVGRMRIEALCAQPDLRTPILHR